MNEKKEIRSGILKLRDSLNANDVESNSDLIQAKLWSLIESYGFKSIMFYIAFGSEVQTQICINKALDKGLNVIVPVCIKTKNEQGSIRDILPSRLLNPQFELAKGTFGVLEPKTEFRRPFPPEEIDLVVVPGVAFDERCYRIGYGAGYYDRFLPGCTKALLVALAYEMQIVADVFPASWDVPVNCIITEKRMITIDHPLDGR
jgi:5-formyltetrahydrofolate cyclo-ligase